MGEYARGGYVDLGSVKLGKIVDTDQGGIFVPDDVVQELFDADPFTDLTNVPGLSMRTLTEGRSVGALSVREFEGGFTVVASGDYLDRDSQWHKSYGGPPQCVLTKPCRTMQELRDAVARAEYSTRHYLQRQIAVDPCLTAEDVAGIRGVAPLKHPVWKTLGDDTVNCRNYTVGVDLSATEKFAQTMQESVRKILRSFAIPSQVLNAGHGYSYAASRGSSPARTS